MIKKETILTKPEREQAFLVGIDIHNQPSQLSMKDSLYELSQLADTAGLDISGEIYQRIDKPSAVTFIGSGKVEEIKSLLEETCSDIIIFDTELSPRHLRELEERFGGNVRVLDRTALILDIFAQHAHTREGILQVELAQYEYRLPRLTNAWTHLARQAGGGTARTGSIGGVGLRGPGETQLEVDKREIRKRISVLKRDLERVRAHRKRHRYNRKRTQIPVITLVGYTNSGKSTLLNQLSRAKIYTANQLFATLDPTTRRVELPDGHTSLFTDTVGFIQKLPTQLIAAFSATLEEINESNLLVHVVDITQSTAIFQWRIVQDTLKQIGADHIPYITVLNKIDLLPNYSDNKSFPADFSNAVFISALKGIGIDNLLSTIEKHLFDTFVSIKVLLPYQEGHLISLFHEQGQVALIEHTRGNVYMQGQIPGRFLANFQPYYYEKSKVEIKDEENI